MDAITELGQWYASQCDGNWEHLYGISISSLDNPGWYVKIDLAETYLESRSFLRVQVSEASARWWDAQVREGCWVAACDPLSLNIVLAMFLNWARSKQA